MNQGRSHNEIRKGFDARNMESHSYQNLWDAIKAVITGKFISINVYIKEKKDLKLTI